MANTVQASFEEKHRKHNEAEAALAAEGVKQREASEAAKAAEAAGKEAARLLEAATEADVDFDASLTEGDVVDLVVDDTTKIVAIKRDGIVHFVKPKDGTTTPVSMTSRGARPLWRTRMEPIGPTVERIERGAQAGLTSFERLLRHLFGTPATAVTTPQPIVRPPTPTPLPPRPQQSSTSIVTILLIGFIVLGAGLLIYEVGSYVYDWIGSTGIIETAVSEPLMAIAVRDDSADAKALQGFAAVNDEPKRDEELKRLNTRWDLYEKTAGKSALEGLHVWEAYEKAGAPNALIVFGEKSHTVHWSGPMPESFDGVVSRIKKIRRL